MTKTFWVSLLILSGVALLGAGAVIWSMCK